MHTLDGALNVGTNALGLVCDVGALNQKENESDTKTK